MKKIIVFIFLISVFSCSTGHKEDILEDSYTIEGYQPLTLNSHTSEGGFARIDDHTILVIYRKDVSLSHISNSSKIVSKISLDNGDSWGEESLVYDSPYDDRNLIAGNLPNGKIIVVFRRYNADLKETIDSGYIISSDKGNTWSTYSKINGTEGIRNQPYGNILVEDNMSKFLMNYDKGITKMYSSSNNFTSHPQETTIVNDPTKILQEPFLVNLSEGKSIILYRNGDGASGQSSYYQYNSIDGYTYTYKGETNLFDDFNQSVRSPVSLRYDKNTGSLEVCTNSRILSSSSDKNMTNELRIYRQNADSVFNDEKAYQLKHTLQRPLPSNHWFYGYPKSLNITEDEIIYLITDAKINDLSVSPLNHITNEQANLYTFKVVKKK